MNRIPLLLAAVACVPMPAFADDFASELANAARMTLLPGWQDADGRYVAAVRLQLAPGWKTYWREPGSAGIAPEFDWSGSDNVAAAEPQWPAPQIFDLDGTRVIGFAEEMILPFVIAPMDPDQPVQLSVSAAYGVCKDICIPITGEGQAAMTPETIDNHQTISSALDAAPRAAADSGVETVTCRLDPLGEDYVINVDVAFAAAAPRSEATILELGSRDLWVSGTEHRQNDRNLHIRSDVMYFGEVPWTLNREAFRLTVIGPDGAIDIQGCG